MYELAKNPQKAIHLDQLAQVNPQAAFAETKKLAESIKQNQVQFPSTNPPLSPLTPSVNRTDNGPTTVSELCQQPWPLINHYLLLRKPSSIKVIQLRSIYSIS